jgi:sugar/nucleoside kinase (ribokinase family)
VGCIGEDQFGALVTETLRERGVDVEQLIPTPDAQTGLTAVYTRAGERGMITYPGAMEQLTIDDIPWAYLERARHLHVSSYYLQRGLRPDCSQLFRRAKKAGLSTSFDTNWDPDETWQREEVQAVLQHVDVFLPNDEEARRISEEENLAKALEHLGEPGRAVVATCGADGVVARSGAGRMLRCPAVSLPGESVVDAVGAGDSFNAGFLQKYLAGAPQARLDAVVVLVQHGLVAGAFSTQAAGGTAAFDDRAAFDRFERTHRAGAADDETATR